MAASLAVWAIRLYRSKLSPRKGWRCAHGQLTGASTCSSVGLRAFRRAGWIGGYALLRRQFDRCAIAAEELGSRRGPRAPSEQASAAQGVYRRLAPSGSRASQAGFVDCGGCDGLDCSGCDMPDCSMPDCSLPNLEMPECGPPSCARPAGGGVLNALGEALYCVDCGNCGSSASRSSSGAARAQAAQARVQELGAKRAERRGKVAGKKAEGEGEGEGETQFGDPDAFGKPADESITAPPEARGPERDRE